MKFLLILSNSLRSKIYLEKLLYENLFPVETIYLNNKKKTIKNFLKKKIKFKEFICESIDNKKVLNYLNKLKTKTIVHCGYPGKIIKNKKILKKKYIIHSHTGKLPMFRGSTAIFYSLLERKKIFCTTFRISKKLDDGNILLCKEYSIPTNIKLINNRYDHLIRIKNIVSVLKSKKINYFSKKVNYRKKYYQYFVAHPLIRYLAASKNNKSI